MDEQPKKTTFEDTVRAVGDDVTDLLDSAVDHTAKFLGGENGNKLVGGAAVGALAAIVLPISLLGGALLGLGYAALRKNQ
ncbi:hypothetical protein [uncultured Sphingomonas sp.]|uniref:hypothetical protein n=1 Tax=uncultured Sphingomonas sp. TaxID=158754 RepID=UPI0035C99191